jgi:hypothetical protein
VQRRLESETKEPTTRAVGALIPIEPVVSANSGPSDPCRGVGRSVQFRWFSRRGARSAAAAAREAPAVEAAAEAPRR